MVPPFFQPPRLEILELVFILLASYPLAQSLTKFIQRFYVSFPSKPISLVPRQDLNSNSYYFMPVQLQYSCNWTLFSNQLAPCATTRLIFFKYYFDHVIHLQCLCLVFICCASCWSVQQQKVCVINYIWGTPPVVTSVGNPPSFSASRGLEEEIYQWENLVHFISLSHFSNLAVYGNVFSHINIVNISENEYFK